MSSESGVLARRGWKGFSAFTVVLAFVLFGLLSSPKIALHDDAVVFLPSALSMATEGTLDNPLWWAAPELNLGDGNTFNSHGVLFPYLVGTLSGAQTYGDLVAWLAGLRGVALCLLAANLIVLVQRPIDIKDYFCVLGVAGLLACVGIGRPEDLAMFLILCLPLTLWLSRKSLKISTGIGGVLLGLIGSVHPLAGVVVFFLLSAWFLYFVDRSSALKAISLIAFLSALLFLTLFAVYPVGFENWRHGFTTAAKFALGVAPGRDGVDLLNCLGLLALGLWGTSLLLWARSHAGPTARLSLALSLVGGLILLYFAAWKPRPYNFAPFIPIFFLAVIVLLPVHHKLNRIGVALFAVAGVSLLASLTFAFVVGKNPHERLPAVAATFPGKPIYVRGRAALLLPNDWEWGPESYLPSNRFVVAENHFSTFEKNPFLSEGELVYRSKEDLSGVDLPSRFHYMFRGVDLLGVVSGEIEQERGQGE